MYLDYHKHIVEDIARMSLIADMIEKDMDKMQGVAPKSKGQRKRDKWARVQQYAADEAADLLK